MKETELTQMEIAAIQQFVEEVKKINIVICVYVGAFFGYKTKEEFTRVVVIYDYDDNKNIERSIEQLDAIMRAYNERFKGCMFVKNDFYNYSIGLMNSREVEAAKDIVSSKIIFDKYKDNTEEDTITATMFKKDVSKYVTPFENTLKINNIDQLLETTINKRKVLTKNELEARIKNCFTK